MASDYGRNFGFRRSDESSRVSEGRFRTPATGPPLLLGTCVEIDPAEEGYLKEGAAGALPRTGICGLLLQEESHISSIYDQQVQDSFNLGVAKLNTLSVVTNGAGTKVWFKNTPAQNRLDGRAIPAVSIFDPAGLAVGVRLRWDGTKWAALGANAAEQAHMEVTFWNPASGLLEATLLK